jgi:uncharacterized membrane protein YjgN (DUF898 family)
MPDLHSYALGGCDVLPVADQPHGSGGSLFGHYIKWWFLTIITFGIYGLWVWPRMTRWVVEHQDFA